MKISHTSLTSLRPADTPDTPRRRRAAPLRASVPEEETVETLRARLFEMGTRVEEIVHDSIVALTTQDHALAATIIPRDDVVDRIETDLEALCLRLLSRPQNTPYELRLISTTFRLLTDIERIGDHAVDIARVIERMERDFIVYKPLVDIPRLGTLAGAMLHEALEAFLHRDLVRVEKTIKADQNVNRLYARMRSELKRTLQEDPDCVLQGSYLLFVTHYIERMCDHCVGIAERVYFMETGRLHPKS